MATDKNIQAVNHNKNLLHSPETTGQKTEQILTR